MYRGISVAGCLVDRSSVPKLSLRNKGQPLLVRLARIRHGFRSTLRALGKFPREDPSCGCFPKKVGILNVMMYDSFKESILVMALE